jgi:hypothetical protein
MISVNKPESGKSPAKKINCLDERTEVLEVRKMHHS